MNIGLIDVDGHNFPNLALMKISAYHKARGDKVDWANPPFGFAPLTKRTTTSNKTLTKIF